MIERVVIGLAFAAALGWIGLFAVALHRLGAPWFPDSWRRVALWLQQRVAK